jgi:predicted outer membrane repeat protein
VSYGANPLVQNVVVSHNLAGNRGGGIYVRGKGEFDHVTVADNATDGSGCISGDPRLVDQGTEDYHLLAESPCIDAGDPGGPLDPDGTRSDIAALPFDQSAAGVAGVPETADYSLRNVPNPFRPSTTIRFNLAEAADVRLSVYSATGRLVTRLLDGPLAAGDHSVSWAGTDARGLHVAVGTYFCRLEDANGTEVRRFSVLP